MTTTAVPGYLTELTVNLVDLGIRGRVVGLSYGKNAPPKPRFGRTYRNVLAGGMKFASFSANGHVDVEGPVDGLMTAFDAIAAVAFEINIGEDGGATDVGSIAGNCVITQLDLSTDAEGEWEWSIECEVDGVPTYTPAP